ncbi:MAG: RDD family protein [Candidatus Thiodiazotropha sp. (ex Myrtea spinifera)]|nr:RDD family protein [Candidatus Thiodiazotropha sp. (ex Myrtea spinifera)]MCU7827813.1 RDD family protein [Candidatus Thiodiazotropha sp. (ex Myrtea sp. 'scaly one' KF741663)]
MEEHISEGGATAPIDTLGFYEIPEGVRLEFRLAGPIVRASAWAIDALIRSLLYLVLSVILALFGGVGMAILLIGFFLIEWFYPVIFELQNGATPGKRMMGILVIQDNGTPVTPAASVIRNLLRTADFLPFLYATGLVTMLINREFKRLGDLAAGTLVVYRDESRGRTKTPTDVVEKPPLDLSEDEQLTLLAFSERAEHLTQDRKEELADFLSEVTGRQGGEGVETLYGYANWIIKGR